jgi:hypothetical protein
VSVSPIDPHAATPAELAQRLEADRRGATYLVYRDADGAQVLLELAPGRERVTIGRSPAADLPLSWDAGVSRIHAAIERMADGWVLVDDGLSRNGTFVNNERIPGRRVLRDRDIVRAGATAIAFREPARSQFDATAPAHDVLRRPELSGAQRRVLVALCRPFAGGSPFATPATNQEIADELVLSVDAIKTHVRTLFEKFGLEDAPRASKRARLVERAFQTGAVGPADFA